ncbi:hypothetical protein PG988_016155 [Apiospora saccharicola]
MFSMSRRIARRGRHTPRPRAPGHIPGANSRLFDDNDLPIIDDQHEATIGELLRRFKFDHVDAAPDRTNFEVFWPAQVLERIMSPNRIIQDLKQEMGLFRGIQADPHFKRDLKSLANTVLGTHPNSQGVQYLKVMALLCYMGHGKEITDWVDSRVSDSCFPFKLGDAGGLCDRWDQKLDFVNHWSRFQCESFVGKQWALFVPYFQLDDDEKALHWELYESTMLPWRKTTQDDRHLSWETSDRSEGGMLLFKFNLKPNGFALKKIKTKPPRDVVDPKLKRLYEFEVAILKEFGTRFQQHLIFLLTSFTLKHDLCFLFPHADCDLQAYWVDEGRKMLHREPEYMRWLSRQLCGLTSAVRKLHGGKISTEVFNDGKTRYCRHGDIRPENVLWFKRDHDKYGVFVLSDMGVSTFNRTYSRSRQPKTYVAQIPGYHPPESVISGGRVDRTFDIWSLGCVYLEMIAWALGGRDYLYKFKDARLKELDTPIQSDVFYKVVREVNDDGKIVDMAMVKSEVRKVSTNMQSKTHSS